jgi:hypothetical protein
MTRSPVFASIARAIAWSEMVVRPLRPKAGGSPETTKRFGPAGSPEATAQPVSPGSGPTQAFVMIAVAGFTASWWSFMSGIVMTWRPCPASPAANLPSLERASFRASYWCERPGRSCGSKEWMWW